MWTRTSCPGRSRPWQSSDIKSHVNYRLAFTTATMLGLAITFGGREPVREISARQGRPEADLTRAIRQARTQAIRPQKEVPRWMDYGQVEAGLAFLAKHRRTMTQVLGTSSLASTFAAKDVTPVLMATGRLPKDFGPRMQETEDWMTTIFVQTGDREEFVRNNYARSVALGRMHAMVAQTACAELRWNPKERLPLNQQAYAFVLYSFAWWPIEAMLAKKEIDLDADRKEIDAWFHYMSVVGYGMGVSENLLPKTYARAEVVVPLLRQAQYAVPGEAKPEGIPVLLGGHMRMLAEKTALRFAKKPADGQPAPKPNTTLVMPAVAQGFADLLKLSPGLVEALGLGDEPAKQLARYAALPPPGPSRSK